MMTPEDVAEIADAMKLLKFHDIYNAFPGSDEVFIKRDDFARLFPKHGVAPLNSRSDILKATCRVYGITFAALFDVDDYARAFSPASEGVTREERLALVGAC